ncbi:MAG: hypothetical protein ABR562_03975 [Thermoplasmatota archaeon]
MSGLPFLPQYDINSVEGAVSLLIAIVLVGLFIHLAAKPLIKKDDVNRALVASMVGILLAQACYHLAGSYTIVGILLAVVAFVAAIGMVYRSKVQGAVAVGAVAWVLWILANFALAYVQEHWRA